MPRSATVRRTVSVASTEGFPRISEWEIFQSVALLRLY